MVIVLDSLHNNFEMTTAPLLYFSDKDVKKIQQIVISIKAMDFIRHAIRTIANLALMAKKKQPKRAAKSKPGKKYFNCGKKGHYAKNCCFFISNKRKLEKSMEEAKRFQWKRN